MATTTAQAFARFQAVIAPTLVQTSDIAARHGAVVKYLAEGFPRSGTLPVVATALVGSAARGTLIRPVDDIDVLAVFDHGGGVWENYRYDSRKFLYRVREVLNKIARVEIVGARGQAVRFFYTAAPNVDIAPVFARSGGGYLIPDGAGGWLSTDPVSHTAYVASRDAELGYQLKPLVRMLKRWNVLHGKRLSSFHLEALAAAGFHTMGSGAAIDCQVWFRWALDNLSVQDPAGVGGDLGTYLKGMRQLEVWSALSTARTRADTAVEAEARGNHIAAIGTWRTVFGEEFPAYG